MNNPSCRFDLQMFADWFADFADFGNIMRTVSTMVLDSQMCDFEDVVSVGFDGADTTGERTERSSRCDSPEQQRVGKGKKAGKGKKNGNGKRQGMEEIQVGRAADKQKAVATPKAEQVCPSVTLKQPALPKGTAFNDDETQLYDHNQNQW